MNVNFSRLLAASLLLCSLQAFSQAGNTPSKNTARIPIPDGPHVMGVFDGRTSCHEIARELDIPVNANCHKVKWRVIFYQHPVTHEPTTYEIKGIYRGPASERKWSIERGIPSDPDAAVIRLDPDDPTGLCFLKADDNILFFLDKRKNLMVGNSDFSYSLSRIQN